MRNKQGAHMQQVRAAIVAVGGVINEIRDNKHFVIFWTLNGQKFIQVTPKTSADWRGLRNALSDIRRHAREAQAPPGLERVDAVLA